MAKVCTFLSTEQQQHHPPITAPTPPPRSRPRVREVNSRFMSPIATSSSSSSGDLHLPSPKSSHLRQATIFTCTELQSNLRQKQRSQSAQRRQPELESSLCCANKNKLEMVRSLETPFGSHSKLILSSQGKPQCSRSVKLWNKENGGCGEHQQHFDTMQFRNLNNAKFPIKSGNLTHYRPETPPTTIHSVEKMMNPNSQPSTNTGGSSEVSMSINSGCIFNDSSETINWEDGICEDKCKMGSVPADIWSSMSGADLLPTVSVSDRLVAQRSCLGNVVGDSSNSKASTLPCYRSLNSPLPSCEPSFSSSYSAKSVHKSMSVLYKPQPSSLRSCLPLHPSTTKFGTEARKGRKAVTHIEDVHALRLLHNRYMQWRYTNAKSEATMNVQLHAAERSLYALLAKESELHDCVKGKRIELGHLKKTITLTTIVEAQMPYLEEWSSFKCEYSSSLSGAVKALQDVSLQLPIIGNVRVNMEELEESLKSASEIMEFMSFQIDNFLPKAEKMDTFISELAQMVSEERALIEECGDLLTKMHILQVEECSLRGQLIQLKPGALANKRKNELSYVGEFSA